MAVPVVHYLNGAGSANIRVVGGLIAVLDEIIALAGVNWTKTYSGTDIAVYKQPAAAGDFYFHVDDTNATYSLLTGYKNMTDINTGTDGFGVTTTQYFRKYDGNASTDPGHWFWIGTDKFFYLFNKYGTVDNDVSCIKFGKPNLVNTADAYGCILSSAPSSSGSPSSSSYHSRNNSDNVIWCRDRDGSPGELNGYRSFGNAEVYIWSGNGETHPFTGASQSLVTPMILFDDSGYVKRRAILPGMLCGTANQPWAHEAQVPLSGEYSGDTAYFFRGYSTAGVLINVSNTNLWD